MFSPITHGGLVVVPPIVYHEDGTVTLSLFGPTDEMQTALDRIPDLIDIDIEEVSGLSSMAPAVESRLSDRQREALSVALELGYYEIPREASHEDVADELGCAPSTAAEHLRKAESTVLRTTFD
jgi:predicted DNA binding protein